MLHKSLDGLNCFEPFVSVGCARFNGHSLRPFVPCIDGYKAIVNEFIVGCAAFRLLTTLLIVQCCIQIGLEPLEDIVGRIGMVYGGRLVLSPRRIIERRDDASTLLWERIERIGILALQTPVGNRKGPVNVIQWVLQYYGRMQFVCKEYSEGLVFNLQCTPVFGNNLFSYTTLTGYVNDWLNGDSSGGGKISRVCIRLAINFLDLPSKCDLYMQDKEEEEAKGATLVGNIKDEFGQKNDVVKQLHPK